MQQHVSLSLLYDYYSLEQFLINEFLVSKSFLKKSDLNKKSLNKEIKRGQIRSAKALAWKMIKDDVKTGYNTYTTQRTNERNALEEIVGEEVWSDKYYRYDVMDALNEINHEMEIRIERLEEKLGRR